MRGTFGLFGHNLPRFKAGERASASALNALVDAVERSRPVPGSGTGLNYTQLPNGFAAIATQDGGPLVMVVTQTITAMSGTAPGHGLAVVAAFDSSIPELVAGSGAAVDVWNYHEREFLETAIIAALSWSGALWVFDVNKCSLYQ